MKILIKGWLGTNHSYGLYLYYLTKYLSVDSDLTIYYQDTEYYNPDWEKKFEHKLNIIPYENQEYDLVFRVSFPYIFDKNETKPQLIFYTTEIMEFYQTHWNLTLDEIIEYQKKKRLFLLTPSNKSAFPYRELGLSVNVIPHGYDPEVFFRNLENYRTVLRIPDGAYVYLNISSCTGNKNLHLIIQAFSKLEDNSVLILKGINSLYHSQQILAATLQEYNIDISKFIHRLRFLFNDLNFEELNKLYNTANCYVSFGEQEAFDVPIVEARACGLKVISHINSPSHHLAYIATDSLDKALLQVRDVMNEPLSEFYSYKEIADETKKLFLNISK